MITHSRLQEVLDYDPSTGVFRWRVYRGPWAQEGHRAGYVRQDGYRCISIDGKKYREQRLAWFYVCGVWPPTHIDHMNRDVSNNAMSELRLATPSQNIMNKIKQSNNTSGYKGVSWHKPRRKWVARIKVNRKYLHLGLFATPQQAHAAYVDAAKQHFGAYARYA